MSFHQVNTTKVDSNRRSAPAAHGVSTRRWRRLLGALVLLLPLGHASAQLMVHPTRVVLEGKQRTGQLEVINNSNEPTSYRISIVNRRMGVNGEFSDATTAQPGEQFADSMLRYSPRRVSLAPGASQVIRIMARKPANLPAGEYRSHLLFSKQGEPAGPNTVEPPTQTDIAVTLTALVGVSIPVIVREGETAATVTLGDLALTRSATGQPMVAGVLRRSGNRSVYGDLTASFTPRGGVPREVGKAGGVAVYTPNDLRNVKLVLTPAAGALANGMLTVIYRERPEHGGALLAEASLSLP